MLRFGMVPRFGGVGIKKNPNRSFPGAWPQEVKTFEFEVLGIQKHPNRSFYHPGVWPQDVKPSNSKFWRLKNVEFKGLIILEFYHPWGMAPGC